MTFNKLVLDGRRALNDSSKEMIKHGVLLLERALLIGSEDEQLIADINSELGSAYFSLHDFEQAKNFFINDLTTSKRLKNEVKEVEAYSNLSVAYAMLLDFNSSIYCAGRVIILGARLNDDVLKAKGYYNCGFAYLQDALTCSEADDSDGTSHLYNQYIREQLQKSVFSFKEYLSIMERQQDKEVSGLALGNLANAYFCLSEYNKSIDCNEKRLEIARDLDDKLAIGRTLINLAKAYNKLGNHELAERNLLAAQRISKGPDFPEELKAKIEFELENVNKPLDERRTIDDSLSLSSKQSPSTSGASSYTNKILKRYCKSVTNLDSLGSRKAKKRFLATLTSKKLSNKLALGDEGNDGEFLMDLIERSNKQIDDQRVCPEKISKIPLNFDDSDFASSSSNSRRLSLPRQKLASFKSGAIKSVTNIPKFFSGKNTKRFSKKENVSDDVSSSMGGSLTSRIIKMEVKDD
uniref:Uncharacterized protein n=2 Tax=Meloidogyne TaxID=189290 RepID=A0A6V7XWB7_MELEN|nr:unnamed protein product [Meloidogyne enterolobii]